MTLRIILALILAPMLALAAVPGMSAACHDAPLAAASASAAMHMHHGGGDKAVAGHHCLGCIPLADRDAGVAVPVLRPAAPLATVPTVLDPGRPVPPATPPPRIA